MRLTLLVIAALLAGALLSLHAKASERLPTDITVTDVHFRLIEHETLESLQRACVARPRGVAVCGCTLRLPGLAPRVHVMRVRSWTDDDRKGALAHEVMHTVPHRFEDHPEPVREYC